MKKIITSLSVAALFAISSSLWAGQCCVDTAAKVDKGEACDKCATHECCKAAAKKEEEKLGKELKPCTVCAAKAKAGNTGAPAHAPEHK